MGGKIKINGRHPTLSDVARHAGVGTTTVSRAINGGAQVKPATLALVNKAIRDLGFVPNLAARVLKGEQSKTVGLIVPSIADPFFSSCAEAIQTVARSFGSLVVLTVTHNDPAIELENIAMLFRRVDGLLLVPSSSSDRTLLDRLAHLSIPVICFDRPLKGACVPEVLTDNFQSSRNATRHLIQHGYKRILCLGGESEFYTVRERIRGYSAAMLEAGHGRLVDVSPLSRSSLEIEEALQRHLDGNSPPQAIFSLKNTTTIDIFSALQRRGIQVPEEVALVGFDDFTLAATLRPSITVVRQPVEEIGATAARLLFRRLSEPELRQPRGARQQDTIRLKGELILRASCGCSEPAFGRRQQES